MTQIAGAAISMLGVALYGWTIWVHGFDSPQHLIAIPLWFGVGHWMMESGTKGK